MSPQHSSDDNAQPLHPLQRSWKRIIIRILIILVVVALVALAYIYLLQPYMGSIDAYVRSLGVWGPLAFIGIFFVCTFLFLLESIFSIAAGTLFGLWTSWTGRDRRIHHRLPGLPVCACAYGIVLIG